MLTLDELKNMNSGIVFAKGTVENSPDGIYMTESRKGDMLVWVAKRGTIHDWAIYVTWEENGEKYALDYGDKLYSTVLANSLVPSTDEALKMYRL